MDRARRRLASAIDGIRNLTTRTEIEVDEKISSDQCCLTSLVRHGFPDDPRCMAFDPVQRLLAIGAGHGCVRILGQAGVDYHLKHDSEEPVTHIQFLVNEGGLVTALRDDTIHLWNYRQKVPEIVHSLKMGKERLTCVHLPFQSKWLHVGTDKGNTYFVSLSTFELSTYVINWNKAIDLSCRTHPGAVRDLSLCPGDTSKLLIVFEKGHVVLWNIPTREAERFAIDHSPAKCVSWHYDGRQFMCGHKDGSLTIWNIRKPKEVVQKSTPHAPNDSVACRPITRLCWHSNAEGEQLIVFAGGMPADEGVLPALTVLRAKGSVTVLEMDHAVVEMCALNASPFTTTVQYPYAVAVLLKNDLLVVDMTSQGYPCLECPYPMDLHESPVTYLNYFSDCPVDLIAALTLVGRTQRRQGVRLSEKPWPITGGVGRDCATGHQEMLLTGHEDGSIKFWQASGEYLQIMYKLKTGRHFEKSSDSLHVSYAVTHVELCTESRLLLVAGACGQVSLFRFVKTESCQDVAVVLLHQLCSSTAPPPSPPLINDDSATDSVNGGSRELKRTDRVTSRDSHSTDTSVGSSAAESLPIKVRGGALRRPAGYQPELVCQIPWIGGLVAEKITAIALNSAYGVIAVGTATGMALVDIVTSSMIYAWSNSELQGRDAIVFGVPSQNSDASPSEPLALKRSQLKPPTPSTCLPVAATDAGPSPSAGRRMTNLFRRGCEDRLSGRYFRKKSSTSTVGPAMCSPTSETPPPFIVATPPASPLPTSGGRSFSILSQRSSTSVGTSPFGKSSSTGSLVLAEAMARACTSTIDEDHCPLEQPEENPPGRSQSVKMSRLVRKFTGKLKVTRSKSHANDDCHGHCATPYPHPEEPSHLAPGFSGSQYFSPFTSTCDDPLTRLAYVYIVTMGFSTMNPTVAHPHNRNTLGRLNTDVRQRSTERHRPVLSKAQSVAAAQDGQYEGSNGDLTVPEAQQNGVGSSPTPSMTSLEKLSLEFVTSLAFISCPSKKGSAKSEPCLWLGMSTGACVAFNLFLPTDRIVNNVVVSPSDMIDGPKGTVVRLQERILYAAFLDRKFCLITAAAEPYKDPSKDSAPTSANIEKAIENKVVTKASLSPTLSNATDNSGSTEQDFDQVAIFVSEREIRVIALPTYQQLFHQRPDIPLVKAKSSHIRGYPVLICLNAAAHVFVYSLPSLRPLFSSQLFRCSIDIDDPIRQKTDFSEHGLGMYMATQSEVQKFTVNAELAAQVADCAGEIFVPRDMPEPPKTSFLRGMSSLFAGGQKEATDLDTIFSEKPSTTAVAGMKSVARTIPTNSSLTNMERTNAGSISAAQAATMAIQGLNERGERLNAVIDATENLRNNAMTMQSRSAKLLEKYEKKKWYQL